MRSSRRVCRSKRRVAISKRIVVRSSKSAQVQKKCNEVQKKCFPSFSSLVVCVGLPWLPSWPDFVSSLACCSNRQKTSKDHTSVSILWESLLFLLFLDREKGTCCTDSILSTSYKIQLISVQTRIRKIKASMMSLSWENHI